MVYVMSDIHGCYDKYKKMLDKIAFCEDDMLYILGDVVDRGISGMKVLLDIADRDNIVLIRGNHDQTAGALLSRLHMLDEKDCPKALVEVFGMWLSDGGDKTLAEFLELSDDEREKTILTLRKSIISTSIVVNDKIFLLSHTVPEIERLDDFENWTVEDYIMGEPNYEEVYFEDKIIVTGHTPTGLIEVGSKGRIWNKNNHIAIDCGAVFGNPLGCICLETFEEFYVI